MTIIQHKRGTSSNWTSSNPVLAVGEIGYETNTGKFKIGDGASAWSALSYFSTSAGGSGTVTSVDMSVPTGLSVSGNPITTSGTLALTFSSGYSIPTTAKQTEWDTAYGWGNHASAGYQAGDADLTAIAALSADGLLRKTSGTWGMDSTTYLSSESDTLSTVTGRGATTNTAISLTNSTTSTSTTTGALKVTGGVGIQENLNVGGNLTLTGDLTVNGTTTTLNSTVVTVDDPIFTLGGDTAPGTDDNKDRGIAFRWHNGSTAKIGFFGFDDSAQQFTFIPDATITSEVVSGTVGTIFANLNGNATSADTATTATTATDATSADTIKTISNTTNASFYPVFVDANNGTSTSELLYTDAGLVFNPSTNNLAIGGDMAINGGDLTSSQTTFNMLTGTTTTLNLATAATTAINIGTNSGGTLTLASPNITLSGFSGSTGLLKSTAGVISVDTSTYLTSSSTLTAGNLSGTIPTGVLGNSSLYVGTTSIALNRSSANLALTGITAVTGGTGTTAFSLLSADTSGAASGAVLLSSGEAASSTAGTVKVDTGNNGTPGSGGANVSIGTTNASSVTIGRSGITTTIAGTLSATVSNATDATSADTVKTVAIGTNASFYPVFVDANNGTATSEALYTDAGLVYNPSSNQFTIGGNLVVGGVSIQLEGATADSFETLLTVTDPTADRTITFPDASGTVALTSDISGFVTSVTGTSPINSSGGTTPAISLATSYGDTQNPYGSKTTNYVLAGPAAGPSAAPSFRALVSGDIPDLSGTYLPLSGGSVSGQIISTHSSTWSSPAIIIGGAQGAILIKDTDSSQADAIIGTNAGSFFILGDTASDGTFDTTPFSINLTSGATTLLGDLAVNGGDITTTATGTATLFNTNATTLNIGGAATTMAIGSSTSTVTFGNTISADEVYATNNGNGTNFKVGDDTWLGDINISNTLSIRGQQDAANAYIVFGNGDSKALGRAGTAALTYDSAPVMVGYYYVTSAGQGPDETETSASMLDGGTLGITVAAGNTYQIEVVSPIQHTYIGSATATTSFGFTATTVTGSPTASFSYQIRYGSNTTGFTTASAESIAWRTTGSQLIGSAIASGSRYIQCHVVGIVRVTGTGTVKIYPTITQSATGNTATAQAGSYFRINPIGNGTVTSAGSGWA